MIKKFYKYSPADPNQKSVSVEGRVFRQSAPHVVQLPDDGSKSALVKKLEKWVQKGILKVESVSEEAKTPPVPPTPFTPPTPPEPEVEPVETEVVEPVLDEVDVVGEPEPVIDLDTVDGEESQADSEPPEEIADASEVGTDTGGERDPDETPAPVEGEDKGSGGGLLTEAQAQALDFDELRVYATQYSIAGRQRKAIIDQLKEAGKLT